jgi:mono/diheme cytochrome c family protein
MSPKICGRMRTIITIVLAGACAAIAGSRPGAAQTATAANGQRTTWSGVYSEAQAKRGEALYAEKCASCHAPDLSGLDQAPALVGADFNTNWNDLSINDFFERIRISMPADNPGSLSREQVADLVAFTLAKGNFPAGTSDLGAQADVLKGISFAAKKP